MGGLPRLHLDSWRSNLLLITGDKSGRWSEWYDEAIPLAEQRCKTYVSDRAQEEGGRP
ncbi:hypothetical protein AB0B15_09470 [Streptomyces sp. NPDC045456]|uniref:hypothetical protein n=1 Tax=Streptomyces sp. NPDC045456 TaxID=3155254 RepID=UPI0033CFAC7C